MATTSGLTPREIAQRKIDAANDAAVTKRNAAAAAKIPPPTSNLSKPGTIKGPAESLALGVVTAVTIDGKRCAVDVSGTEWNVVIPGSVLGVQVGRTVQVRTVGNSRTVASVVTPIPSETYTSSPDTEVRGNTPVPPDPPDPTTFSWTHTNITSFSIPTATASTLAEAVAEINVCRSIEQSLLNRLLNPVNVELNYAYLSNVGLVETVNDMKTNLDSVQNSLQQLTDKVDTLIRDLSERGLLKN